MISGSRWVFALAGLLALAGCRTPAPTQPARAVAFGDVLRFHEQERFVVVFCEVLPSPGDEATVSRDDQPVARIRFTGPARPPYATADVLDGWPQRGDRFRVDAKGARGGAEMKP